MFIPDVFNDFTLFFLDGALGGKEEKVETVLKEGK